MAAVIVGSIAVGACSDSDEATTVPTTDTPVVSSRATTSDDELFTPVPGVVESLPAVAETGVPGIESDDAFCRSWSEYAGSVQALSLAWGLQDPAVAARLEVAASDAVIGAVALLGAELPTALEANRQAFTVDVPGPFLARAELARQALVDAGATDEQIVALGVAWLDAIAAAGLDAPDVVVDVPADVESAVAIATDVVIANLPSIVEDPTLDTTEFDITPSLDYISATCPDQGTLAGNDVIEDDGI